MAEKNKQYQVKFNKNQYQLYIEAKNSGLTKRKFSEFVKDAFYTKLETEQVKP